MLPLCGWGAVCATGSVSVGYEFRSSRLKLCSFMCDLEIQSRCLRWCAAGAVLLELFNHALEIGIAGTETPGEPVSTALGNFLAVGDYLELAGLAGSDDGFNAEALLDEGHETRDLGLVVLSRRAVDDLDFHLFSKLLIRSSVPTNAPASTSSTRADSQRLASCCPCRRSLR
jgi:hypothetical protein